MSGVLDSQADRLIRNVYKVLLTRGMRGVSIHSVDQQTNDRLRGLIGNTSTTVTTQVVGRLSRSAEPL
jgi:uncharacterized protein